MVTFDANMILLVVLSALFLPTEGFSQIIDTGFTPPCPVGWIWVQEYGKCVPWLRAGGPGGRWRSGRGGKKRTKNLLPIPRPFMFSVEPVCPPGQIWVESFQECVPWLRGGPGGRWRSAMEPDCPPAWSWRPDIGECVRPNIHVTG